LPSRSGQSVQSASRSIRPSQRSEAAAAAYNESAAATAAAAVLATMPLPQPLHADHATADAVAAAETCPAHQQPQDQLEAAFVMARAVRLQA